jgi:precorrin-8X/cobalt-precorrin-8 methylmutase
VPDLPSSFAERQIVKRIVHTTGDPGLAKDVWIHPRAVERALAAIKSGAAIYADVRMLAAGLNRGRAEKFGCEILCAVDDPEVAKLAREQGLTRATLAIHRLAPRLNGAIVAIGNSPTALFTLLELVEAGEISPAVIIGTPLGFVGAAESKEALRAHGLPCITVRGTRGGSAIAVASVNALLRLAEAEGEG